MRTTAARTILTLSVVALGYAPTSFPADYYVATTGSDTNPGTQASPWRTIQRAYNQPVAPGDTVHVQAGTYVGWATDIAGTPSAPITWKADGAVIIDQPYPGGPGNPNDNIRLMYADSNIIDGFESTNAPRAGIAVRGDDVTPIRGCVVRNCSSHDNNTWGIFDAFADDSLYENNTCSRSCGQHGIYHSNSGDRAIIRYNTVLDNAEVGLHNNGDISMGGDGICSNLQIYGNIIGGNGGGGACGPPGGAGINMDGVQDSLIANNLIYDEHATGIAVFVQDGGDGSKRNLIVNNTVMIASDGRWAIRIVDEALGLGSTGNTVFNNVFYRNDGFRGSISIDALSLPGFTSDYNVLVDRMSNDGDNTNMTLAQWRGATSQDANSILIDDNPATLDTYFVSPAGNDWHLKAASPAIDAGIASLAGKSAPATDFEQDSRPQGANFDIGCDEYGSGGGAPTAQFVGSPLSGPAPLNVQFTDQSTGAVSSWAWTFGDGGTATSQNPTHTYGSVGSFTVALTVTGPGGSDTETKPGYITVTGSFPIDNFLSGRGRGFPNGNDVVIHALGGGAAKATFIAYGAGQWGTLVASGDVDGNGLADALTGPGPGAVYGPQVRAFQPNGTPIAKVNYYAYGTLRYGVNVAGADLDGDAPDEILSGAGPGAVFGPHVRGWNFDGATLQTIAKVSYFAYNTLKYGVNADDGDVDGDGFQEILTGPGPSAAFGPTVRGFNYDGATLASIGKINFNAFAAGGYGANIAGGSVDADGYGEILAGRGPGAALASQLKGYNYDGGSIAALAGLDATPFTTLYGARVHAGDIDADGLGEVVTGPGEAPSASSTLASYDYTGSALAPIAAGTFAPFAGSYGTIVATGRFGY